MRYLKEINDLTFNMYPVVCDKGDDVSKGAAIVYNVMDYERLTTKINKSKNSSKFLSRYNYGFYTKRRFYQREGRGFIRLNIDQTSIYKFIKKNCPTIKFTYKEMDNYNLKNVFIDVAQFNSDFFNNTLILLNESTTLEPLSESAFNILNEEIMKVKESVTQEEYDLDLISEAANLSNSLDAAKIYFTLLMSYLSEVNVYPNKYLVFDLKTTSLTYGNMMSVNRGMLKKSYTPDDMLMQLIRFEFANIEVLNLFKGYTIILEGSNGMCKFNIDSYIQRVSEDKDKAFKDLLKKLTIIMNRIDFKEDAPLINDDELKELEDNPPFTELDVIEVNTNTIVENLVSHNDTGETISNIETIVKDTLDKESIKDEKKSNDEIVGEMLTKVIDIRIKNTKQIMPKEREYLKKLTNVSVNNEGIKETIDLSKKAVIQPKVYDIKTINNDMKEVKFDNIAKTYDMHFRDHDILNYCKLLSETSTPLYLDKVNKKDSSDRLNSKDTYQLFFKDESGNKHTFSVDVPKLVPDTDYIIANGDKKKLTNQIVPHPITKVGEEVYIVTNYNKVFMFKKGGRYINPHQSIVSRILLDLVKSNKTFTGVNLLSTHLTNLHDGRMSSEIIEISKYLTSIERDGVSIFLNPNRCKFTEDSIIIGTYKGYDVHVDKTTDIVTLKDSKGDIHNDILSDTEYELELVEEQRTLMIDKHKEFIDLNTITYKNFDNHIHSVLPYTDPISNKEMTLRYRAECLIFSDDGRKIYLCKSKENDERNRTYYLPGGSAEPTKHIEEQLRAEIREEAGLEVVNLNYANSFITDFEGVYPEWHKKYLHPNGLTYDGYFTELFVAKYAGPIMSEVPNMKDIDNYMRLNGKFYDIATIYKELTHEHKEAIDKFLNIFKVGVDIEDETIDSLKEIIPTLESRHGMSTSKLYYIWTNMKYRCYNKTSPKYHVYGGRGITMDKEWLKDFNNFYLWSIDNGYVEGLSLDRIDNNKGYTPLNCRWITVPENSAKRAIDNKDYEIEAISPEGDKHRFKNISQFARDNNLHGPNVNAVVLGQRNHHKGWTFSKIRESNTFMTFKTTKLINNDSELIHIIEDYIKVDEIGAKTAGVDKILNPSFFNNGYARIIKYEGNNVGVVTLQKNKSRDDTFFIGIYVQPDYRGLGLAKYAINKFSQDMKAKVLVANIASDNESSKGSHLKNGFRRATQDEIIKYGVSNNTREMYIRYENDFLVEEKSGIALDNLINGVPDSRPDEDYNSWELETGIDIEHEHSPDDTKAKIIAKDHLDEFPDYYTRLIKMEKDAKIELQEEKIVKKDGKYFVLSEGGKNLGKKSGYTSKKDAMKRLRQVEVFKHLKENNEFPDNREFKTSEFLLRVIREIFKEDETVKEIFEKNRNVPSMFSSTYIKIIGKELPLIMCLCYTHGLFTVLDSLDENDYKIVPKEEKKIRFDKLNIGVIEFKNSYLTYDNRKQELVSLFAYMGNYDFTNYNIEELEDKETNGLILAEIAGSTNTPLYLDNYKDLLIDPVTKEILRDLNQPTEFLGVFLYANNLLNTGFSAIQEDLRYCRIRNNEILTASFYEAIASAYGDYSVKKKRGSTLASFSLNKNAVINVLHNVSSYQEFSVTNPVASIDATREVSFKGLHGKNLDRAFGLESRLQNDTYAGIIGASSVYSAGVGVSKHLTLNPKIKHIRGYLDITTDANTLGSSEVELATELNAPLALTHNSPERNFMDVSQQKQTIPVIDMQPLFISSGFNKYIPKAGTEFTYLAKDDGVVEEITSVYLKVKYKEKGTKIFPLTLIERNTNKSKYYKNELKPAFKVGEKFREGDVLAYNRDFFSNKGGEIVYNTGTLATIALHMTANNFEDSFELTSELAHRMATETTKLRSVKIPANTKIKNYIKEFDKLVDAGVPLIEYEFMVEDEGLTKFLDINDIDELTTITKKNLFRGKVISCKIYYTCDESEFSPSMKSFVKYISDWVKDNRDERVELPLKVPEGTKLNGKRLEKNEVLIEYYVTYMDVMSDGDKLTVFSALKGIVSKVIPEVDAPYGIDTGIKVEGILSTMSPKARKTEAFLTTGLINRAMEEFTKNMRNQLE